MMQRMDYAQAAPGAFRAMAAFERYVRECGLEQPLLELVKIRASQVNACAYCLDMHTKDARAAGETEQRIYLLNAWRESPCYSGRERAALEWTEAVTRIGTAPPSDALYTEVRDHFTEAELVNLTMAVNAINGWNRLAISFRSEVGHHQPKGPATA